MMEYPHRITVCMTDGIFNEIKTALGLRHMMGDLFGECDITLLNMVKAIDDGESNPIYLRSIKEAEKDKKKDK